MSWLWPEYVDRDLGLSREQRKAIQQAINETFAADVHTRFDTAPEIISGIELTVGGKKLAWSIADYLTSLETGVGELLHVDEQTEADSKPEHEATQPAASPV